LKKNYEKILKQVTVIIPSIKKKIITLDSLPDGVEIIIVRGKPVSEARNIGAKKAKGKILVFLDDDLKFPENVLCKCVERIMQSKECLMHGRMLIIRKEDFFRVGGYDEKIYLLGSEDVDFLERAIRKGMTPILSPAKHIQHLHPENDNLHRSKLWKKFLIHFNESYFVLKHKKTRSGSLFKFFFFPCKNVLTWLFRYFGFYYYLITGVNKLE